MADVLIALGGNVGDVRSIFKKAIGNICGMTQAALLARSSDYLTPAWGEEQQDRFTPVRADSAAAAGEEAGAAGLAERRIRSRSTTRPPTTPAFRR